MKAQTLLEKLGSGIREGSSYELDIRNGRNALSKLRVILNGYLRPSSWDGFTPEESEAKRYAAKAKKAVEALDVAQEVIDDLENLIPPL